MTDLGRAGWLLGCAVLTFCAAEISAHYVGDDDERRTPWDGLLAVALAATSVLAVAALAALP